MKTAPAEEVIQHELHRFTGVGPGESPWNMPPGEETDKAWDGLIDSTYSNVPTPPASIPGEGAGFVEFVANSRA